jgi:hypothetical protein
MIWFRVQFPDLHTITLTMEPTEMPESARLESVEELAKQ